MSFFSKSKFFSNSRTIFSIAGETQNNQVQNVPGDGVCCAPGNKQQTNPNIFRQGLEKFPGNAMYFYECCV
jgi:hypothetical protein